MGLESRESLGIGRGMCRDLIVGDFERRCGWEEDVRGGEDEGEVDLKLMQRSLEGIEIMVYVERFLGRSSRKTREKIGWLLS